MGLDLRPGDASRATEATEYALRIVGAARAGRARGSPGRRASWRRGEALAGIDWSAEATGCDFLLSMEGASPLRGDVATPRPLHGSRDAGARSHAQPRQRVRRRLLREGAVRTDSRGQDARARGGGPRGDPRRGPPEPGLVRPGARARSAGRSSTRTAGRASSSTLPRNLTDAQARALAGDGRRARRRLLPGARRAGRQGSARSMTCAHVEHWAEHGRDRPRRIRRRLRRHPLDARRRRDRGGLPGDPRAPGGSRLHPGRTSRRSRGATGLGCWANGCPEPWPARGALITSVLARWSRP